MRIRVVSDFHPEFREKDSFEETLGGYDGDCETVLCCAGDMGIYARTPPAVRSCASRGEVREGDRCAGEPQLVY